MREQETGRPYGSAASQVRNLRLLRNWEDRYFYYGRELYDLIELLERIHFENKYIALKASEESGTAEEGDVILPDDYITDEADRIRFREHPQEYEWTFVLQIE